MPQKSIEAELLLASKNSLTGDILYTFKLTFPRVILAEINTHKIASKNTSSSRAVPVPQMMRRVWEDPFVPITWGTYKKGMQAGPPLSGWKKRLAIWVWKAGRLFDLAEAFIDHYILGLAKEITNRIYERYVWTEQIFSTTDVSNLILLRDSGMAEPHFHELARQINRITQFVEHILSGSKNCPRITLDELDLYTQVSERTQTLKIGQWHLPFMYDPTGHGSKYLTWERFFHGQRPTETFLDYWKKVSIGRCAWVSYYMPGDASNKVSDPDRAVETYKKLAQSDPKHLSPAEHVATPLPESVRCGNFCGFLQARKLVPGEAGGDKVVPSVTPGQAIEMLEKWRASGNNQ